MRAGPEHWHLVTLDTAGVPHGGRYGDVAWFADAAAAEGLRLGWNRLWRCFGVYSVRRRKHYFELLCKKGNDPIPLSRHLLSMLVAVRRFASRQTEGTICGWIAAKERERREALERERMRGLYERLADHARESLIRRRILTRKVYFPAPKGGFIPVRPSAYRKVKHG